MENKLIQEKPLYMTLQEALCKYFNTPWSEVEREDRHANLCQIRRAYAHMAHKWLGRSYRNIAYDLGRVNHVTALYYVTSMESRLWANSIEDIYLVREMQKKLEIKI